MRPPRKLSLILNLEPGEGHLVGLLFLLYFFLGAAYSFTQAAAFPIFLLTFSARDLPWVYMTNAIVVMVITFGYLKLSNRMAFSTLLSGNILFLFLVISAFWIGLRVPANRWVIFGLPVLFQILINFGNLAFWSTAGRLLDVRQAKRIFGLIGGGQWAAIVLTGFLIPLIVASIGAGNLLILAALSMVCVSATLTILIRTYSSQLKMLPARSSPLAARPATRTSPNRYVLSIFGMVILWWVAYYFIDNIFYGQLAFQYPDEEQLASFMGFYLAGQAFLILFINTFLTGAVINRFGVRLGLIVLPAGLIAITASSAVLGTLFGAASILFVLAVLSKLINMGLGFSIDLSAQNIMYQPLPPAARARTKTVADGIVQPLANGLAGLTLLLLNTILALEIVQLSYILLGIIAGWLAMVLLLNQEYPEMLRKALTKRHLEGVYASISDETSVSVLVQELRNPHPGIVLYALSTLESVAPARLSLEIPPLLEHPSMEVRQAVLACIDRLQIVSTRPAVRACVQKDVNPAVRGAALRTLSALGGADTTDTLARYVHDPELEVRKGAMIGLFRNCGIQGILAAGHLLLEMSKGSTPEQRAHAAQIIGELGMPTFYEPLIALLNDEVRSVRRAAIQATGRVKNPKLIPGAVKALQDPALRGPAAAVLVAWGEPVLQLLFDEVEGQPCDQDYIAGLIDVIGRIGGDEAIAWLAPRLIEPAAPIRSQVLHALDACGYRPQADKKEIVQQQIRSEAAFATQVLATIIAVSENGGDGLLRDSLHENLYQGQDRIFDLLSFLFDSQAIHDARANLAIPDNSSRAYALEVLDVVVSQPVKSWVSPLWTEGTALQKAQRLRSHFPAPEMGLEQALRGVLSRNGGNYSWCCQACALYTIGKHSLSSLLDCVQQALLSPQPLLRETAVWSMSRLGVVPDQQIVQALCHDPHLYVRRVAGLLDRGTRSEGDFAMLTTLEKVIALKKASIFASLPNEILSAVAPLLEEIWHEDGSTVIKKGELGDCMYLIVQGKVRVHDGDLTLNFLEAGEVFGEMAVLDSEPRVASVTSEADTCLLCLAQEPFYELMDAQPAIAQGLIRTLSRHLRARIQDLTALQAGVSGKN